MRVDKGARRVAIEPIWPVTAPLRGRDRRRSAGWACGAPACEPVDRFAARDLAEAARAQAILLVVPAQAMRSVCRTLSTAAAAGTPIITCAKGIEHGTRKFMTEVIAELLPDHPTGVLTGPNLAKEIMAGRPAASVIAMTDPGVADDLQRQMAVAEVPRDPQ